MSDFKKEEYDDTDPHAVRWYNRKNMFGDPQWGKWHYTTDSNETLCGRYIRMGIEGGSFLPDTSDNLDKINCKQCIKHLNKINT